MSVPLVFMYRNYRGEVSARRVRPDSVRWGATEWHPEEGWLLRAWDFDKADFRDFAMADMLGPVTSAPEDREVVLGEGDGARVQGVPVESEVVVTLVSVGNMEDGLTPGFWARLGLSVRPLPGER